MYCISTVNISCSIRLATQLWTEMFFGWLRMLERCLPLAVRSNTYNEKCNSPYVLVYCHVLLILHFWCSCLQLWFKQAVEPTRTGEDSAQDILHEDVLKCTWGVVWKQKPRSTGFIIWLKDQSNTMILHTASQYSSSLDGHLQFKYHKLSAEVWSRNKTVTSHLSLLGWRKERRFHISTAEWFTAVCSLQCSQRHHLSVTGPCSQFSLYCTGQLACNIPLTPFVFVLTCVCSGMYFFPSFCSSTI